MILAEAVEDLARALGWWLPEGVARWGLDVHEDGYYLTDWWTASPCDGWQLTPHEAMLVLRCALLGPTRERCPDCAKRGGPMEWRQFVDAWHVSPITGGVYDARRYLGGWPSPGWAERSACWDVVATAKSKRDPYTSTGARASRPCPTCTGPDVEEWARATSRGWTPRAPGLDGPTLPWLGTVTERWRVAPGGFACRLVPGKPTGWLTREHGWAERFLRAQPEKCDHAATDRAIKRGDAAVWSAGACPACGQNPYLDEVDTVGRPGDPEAREQISVKADELAERGQPGCSTCEGSQFEKTGTVLGFLATGTLEAWKRSNPESEGWSVWSQPERGVMIGGGDGVRIVCRRPCPSCASAQRLSLWLALCLGQQSCEVCEGWGESHYTGQRCPDCAGSGLDLGRHTRAMADAGRALAEDLERAELK